MLLNKIVLSKTPPTSPNTVWAKPSNGGVSLYTYSKNKWGPVLSMDDMGTDNPDDDLPAKVITQELFDETIQGLKDYVSENYASNTKVSQIISRLNTLVGADEEGHEIDVTSVIDTFNEIKDFLANIEDTTLIEMFNDVLSKIDAFSNEINTKKIVLKNGEDSSELVIETDKYQSKIYRTTGSIKFNSDNNGAFISPNTIGFEGGSSDTLYVRGRPSKAEILMNNTSGIMSVDISANTGITLRESTKLLFEKGFYGDGGEIVFNPTVTGVLTVLKAGLLILGNGNSSGSKGIINFGSGASNYTIGLASGNSNELLIGSGFNTLALSPGINISGSIKIGSGATLNISDGGTLNISSGATVSGDIVPKNLTVETLYVTGNKIEFMSSGIIYAQSGFGKIDLALGSSGRLKFSYNDRSSSITEDGSFELHIQKVQDLKLAASGKISLDDANYGIGISNTGIYRQSNRYNIAVDSPVNFNSNVNILLSYTLSGGATILNMNYSGSQNTFSLDYIDSLKAALGLTE